MNMRPLLSAFAILVASATLAGPRVSILGDSYSTYEGVIPKGNAIWYYKAPNNHNDVTKAEECWWSLVITNLNGSLECNESWSGSTVCNTGYKGANASKTSFLARSGRLGNPDVILVCGATNDSWANVPIGNYRYAEWTNDELFTFRPALAKMFADLADRYPKAKVYFILNDCLSKNINDSVHEICSRCKVPCIDLKNIDKQKGHPSVAGMKAIAEQVVAEIRRRNEVVPTNESNGRWK